MAAECVNKLQLAANPPFAGKVQDESIPSDLNYKLNTRATVKRTPSAGPLDGRS
jgi:hypothetical protein